MKKSRFFLLTILSLFLSCTPSKKQNSDNLYNQQDDYIQYSNLLSIQKADDYTLVNIKNPWDDTNLLCTYILVPKNKELPTELPEGIIIRTPLSSVALTSSIQCSFIDELGQTEVITGACDLDYIKNPAIEKKKAENKIRNLGMGYAPNMEMLIDLSPEVIFCDPVIGQDLSPFQKSGITVIQTPDYVETNPLGRTEWIKFYALLFDMEAVGDSIFLERASQYEQIKDKTTNIETRPTVFMDMPYQGSWDVSGGESYIANMLRDAGADYLWKNNVSAGFLPLSFEMVLDKADKADFWLIKYYNLSPVTYKSMEGEYKPYTYFDAFKNKNIYACNTLYSSYYEDLPTKPHLLIQDLASIFHPTLFPEYKNNYYLPLK